VKPAHLEKRAGAASEDRPRSAIPPCCGVLAATSIPLDGGGQFCGVVALLAAGDASPAGHTSAGAGPSPACRQRAGELDQKGSRDTGADPTLQSSSWPSRDLSHQNYARQNKLKYNYLTAGHADAISGSIRSGGSKARTLCHGLEQES